MLAEVTSANHKFQVLAAKEDIKQNTCYKVDSEYDHKETQTLTLVYLIQLM